MNNPNHQELEVKIDAHGVSLKDFKTKMIALSPTQYLHLRSPDTYYVQGRNVVRHRHSSKGAGELTVKRRTSRVSTRERQEIDLRFDPKVTEADVPAFLMATGWKPVFTLVKDCHIFYFKDTVPGVEVVLYDVSKVTAPDGVPELTKRFMELEIHKADSNHEQAQKLLRAWEDDVRFSFPLGATQNLSLYEIFSGRRYKLVR